MGSEDLAEMVEEGDLDNKLDDKAAIKVVDDVLVSTLATNTCTAHSWPRRAQITKVFKGSTPSNVKTDPKSMNMTLSP